MSPALHHRGGKIPRCGAPAATAEAKQPGSELRPVAAQGASSPWRLQGGATMLPVVEALLTTAIATHRACCLLGLAALVVGCGPTANKSPSLPHERPLPAMTLSVVSTNDLHGHLDQLPLLAGYLNNLREIRQQDGGQLLLIDAGDMFQGTLESNLGEGHAVIAAYNALGYDAAAVGNHEFDFGPVGPSPIARHAAEDRRGALKARARQAEFPLLMANIVDRQHQRSPGWHNMPSSITISVGPLRVGVIGVSTMDTPRTTMPENFEGLAMRPLAATITDQATKLKAHGANFVIVTAHAGGRCERFDDASDLSSCDAQAEIFEVAEELAPGLVDLIVAGHTHAGVAHLVGDIAVSESYAFGRAFGRVDFVIDASHEVVALRIYPPTTLCREAPNMPCTPATYEGAPVVADEMISSLIEPARKHALTKKRAAIGVVVNRTVRRAYAQESPLGNLFADLMRQARPEADFAITNGGGLRSDLPAGPLHYGSLYESWPFDNRFALLRLTGSQLRKVMIRNLTTRGGILSVSGLRVQATCKGDQLTASLFREDGRALRDDEQVLVATSDFLASGGDGAFDELDLAPKDITIQSGTNIRDAMAGVLGAAGGSIDSEPLFSAQRPRIHYPGRRPVRCGKSPTP